MSPSEKELVASRLEAMKGLRDGWQGGSTIPARWRGFQALQAIDAMDQVMQRKTDSVLLRVGYVKSAPGQAAPMRELVGRGSEPHRPFRLHLAALGVAYATKRSQVTFTNDPGRLPFVSQVVRSRGKPDRWPPSWALLCGLDPAYTDEWQKDRLRKAFVRLERAGLVDRDPRGRSTARSGQVSPWERFRLLVEDGMLDGQGGPLPWVRPADKGQTRSSLVKAPKGLMKVPADFWRQGWYLLLERNEIAALFAFLAHTADLVEQVDADNSVRGIDLGHRYFGALGLNTRRYRAFNYYLKPFGLITTVQNEVLPGRARPNPTAAVGKPRRMALVPKGFQRNALDTIIDALEKRQTQLP